MNATWKYKLGIFAVYAVAYQVFYIFPNFFPTGHPSFLPLLSLDRALPLLPWTFLVYISDYLLAFSAVLIVRELDRFNAYARVAFLTLVMCGTFFLFFPTQYPRPVYPYVDNWLISFVMNMVRNLDTPNNCFPSMHVAITGATVWAVRYKGPRVVAFYSLWSLAIFVSTLTTKQHYVVDVVGGIAVAVSVALIDWVFFELQAFRFLDGLRKSPKSFKS